MASNDGDEYKDISDADLLDVANQIGMSWFDVGIYLQISSAELEHLQTSYPNDSKRSCYKMLEMWKKGQPRETDFRNELAKGLRRAKLIALADKVDDGKIHLHLK